jgi:DNA invertase Pin-like site-specific DNA recombinase
MSARVGYARVSTVDQHSELQTRALDEAGCTRVFVETASGARSDRPILRECLGYLRPGDTLVVWKLDRLGRSLSHLVATVDQLREQGIGFTSLTEAIDTTTAAGRMLLGVMASLAQFERDLVVERTRAGLAAARANGRHGGRPVALTGRKLELLHQLAAAGDMSKSAIARTLNVSRATVYRALGPLTPTA